jgi:serine protein kinase
LYNGEKVVEKDSTKKIDVGELKEDAKREGMFGISTRFIMKALDNAVYDNNMANCVHPINVREQLIRMIKEAYLPDDTRKRYLEFLRNILHKEYRSMLEEDISYAFANSLFHKYFAHAEAYINRAKVCSRFNAEDVWPDEDFLKSIEVQVAITSSAANRFRQQVVERYSHDLPDPFFSSWRRSETISNSPEPLEDAIKKKVITSGSEFPQIIATALSRFDELHAHKCDPIIWYLLEDGYCETCVDRVLKHAADNLWKDHVGGGTTIPSSGGSSLPYPLATQGGVLQGQSSPLPPKKIRKKRAEKKSGRRSSPSKNRRMRRDRRSK